MKFLDLKSRNKIISDKGMTTGKISSTKRLRYIFFQILKEDMSLVRSLKTSWTHLLIVIRYFGGEDKSGSVAKFFCPPFITIKSMDSSRWRAVKRCPFGFKVVNDMAQFKQQTNVIAVNGITDDWRTRFIAIICLVRVNRRC